MCTVKTAIKVRRQRVSTSKTQHSCRASLFLTVYLVACAASNEANLPFKATIIEDTHLTLAVISFKNEANNSLIFLPLQTYETKFAEFPFLLVYNSLICAKNYRFYRNVNSAKIFSCVCNGKKI